MDRTSKPLWTALLSLALIACDAAATPSSGAAPRDAAPTCVAPAEAAGAIAAPSSLEGWAELAVRGTEDERRSAIASLRAAGPQGLEVFVRVHGAALMAEPTGAPVGDRPPASATSGTPSSAPMNPLGGPLPGPDLGASRPVFGVGGALLGVLGVFGVHGVHGREAAPDPAPVDPARARGAAIDAAIDGICRQHACRYTQLYWFTDLEAAKAEARASGRPILSLRLLGDLGDPLSCANSRFFRSILYPAVASALRERFVLHWSSERPAPVVTIDFGDGRRLTRTITGNSVHFVLDAEGRPLDAIPGLLPPGVFMRLLERAAALEIETRGLDQGGRAARLREHHQGRLAELEAAYEIELLAIGLEPSDYEVQAPRPRGRRPAAIEAELLAPSKSRIEGPILGVLGESEPDPRWPSLWSRLGLRHRVESRLTPASLKAMNALQPVDRAMIAATEESLSVDGVRNEYELHREIHRWFALDRVRELEPLTRMIYDELFLTPASDPNLGMAPPEVYAALPGGGWTTTRP